MLLNGNVGIYKFLLRVAETGYIFAASWVRSSDKDHA